MQRSTLPRLGLSLVVNVLFGCTLLPFLIPPFEGFAPSDVLEVLLWQGIAAIGWPFALLGMFLAVLSGGGPGDASALLTLLYPAIQFLLVRLAISKAPRRVEFILMHALVVLSFAAVWHRVLNGYDFMAG